ncbi:MAG: SoxR reducing system RseC family protein [Clostridiales bacterium]|nr:SoxR reducing system RseC family protein [Clostridiales bacterium]
MNAKAYVIECSGKTAKVSVIRRTACDSCASCAQKDACHAELLLSDANKTYDLEVENTVNAQKGDLVEIQSEDKKQLALSALLFVVPVILGIIAYTIVFYVLNFAEYAVLSAVFAVAAAFFVCAFCADRYSKKHMKSYITKIIEESSNKDARQ